MSLVVHYRCHQCGATREGGGDAGWVRCQHCAALIGFDFQAWLGSKRYAAYLREAAKPETMARWATYQQQFAKAVGEGRDGLATMEAAADLMMTLNPVVAPEEVSTNGTYRAAVRRFMAFTLLMQQVEPRVKSLADALTARLSKLDYANPLPTLEWAVKNLEQQFALLAELGPPDDPDGLPWPARMKASLAQFLTGYLQLLSGDDQRRVLERVYGKDALHGPGAAQSVDALGLYLDWSCPACGLASLQARMVTEYTCPGCMFRKPVAGGDASLPEVKLACARCGAPVALGAGERERTCEHCNTWLRRIDRTGDVERDFANEVKARVAAEHGLVIEALPQDGKPGFEVTAQTRRGLQLTGVTRVAAWYGALVPAKRIRGLVERTFGPAGPALWKELEAVARAEGNDAALPVLAQAAQLKSPG
ncbi:MAG: hypothetical protein JNJ54_30610 [Myxococcaceae bacterium]|nr:hypothetical protein [Myxococcaceae bacterium]